MLYLKKRIGFYLKYPLMWVMLLWAVTLPGHEVVVYNFLLNLLAGKAEISLVHVQEQISRSGERSQHAYVFIDAAPASFVGKLQLSAVPLLPGDFALSFYQYKARVSSLTTAFCTRVVQQNLLVSILPNAP